MSYEKVIGLIECEVLKLAVMNNNWINADLLLKYLKDVKNSPEYLLEVQRDVARYAHERQMENYKVLFQKEVLMVKSVLDTAQSALKYSILINGGAAVALLAFFGNVLNKEINVKIATVLTEGLILFSYGTLAGALGAAFTYLSQSNYAQAYLEDMEIELQSNDKKTQDTKKKATYDRLAFIFKVFAIFSVFTAYAFFFYGVNCARTIY